MQERLEIGTSTLRKWCLSLEQENHSFVKATKDSLAFVEKDILENGYNERDSLLLTHVREIL
ncbi:hypothetical protein [Bacillus cereus group sp. N12]|uniref:hypothetical protein n=1 Tax=Bacillus cereus group sp. N12 TaxID=2794586 RepID=UPI001F5B7FF7|nr:hypothetical protein [Bacillus cereus group sp. N12]